ncbi:MAG: SAM-dependent methyltransferase [Prevotellaceae bacterium]|jgi:16S rRNA G966 N2-methylase RsmD|nr:SAM-dependent methyltransferase [Prevotellaceae bacterium]
MAISDKSFNISEQTQNFIRQHIDDDSHLLALAAKQNSEIDLRFALEQIAARQHSKEKIHSWYSNDKLIFPPKISVEQCSSEATAKYKAELCKGESFADLTGGFGIDFSFISQNFNRSFYVEKNEYLSRLAKHNFDVLGLKNIEIVNCSGDKFLENAANFDCIYIDPSRRNANNKKEILLENCSPNILKIKDIVLKKSKNVIIKLSPVFDIVELERKFTNIRQIHVVAVKNECKELLVKLEQNTDNKNIEIVCVNMAGNEKQIFSFKPSAEKSIEYDFVPNVQKYLYEPNVAVQKSGGCKSFAQNFNLKALNANSKIYTSDIFVNGFCGRIFIVENVFSFNKTELKKNLKNISKANITIRNFPLSVAELRKKLNIDEGGDIYLFATTLFDGSKVIIQCRKDI